MASLLDAARKLQQNYYELSSDWNIYERSEHKYLKKNIGYAIFGPPSDQPEPEREAEYDSDQKQVIASLYDKIVTYGSNSSGQARVYCNIVYNVIFGFGEYESIFPVPVFKVRRCQKTETDTNSSAPSIDPTATQQFGEMALLPYCVWYIDTEGRVYQNWTDYVTNNTLPKCTMVVPMGGHYQPNPLELCTENSTLVWLEDGPSPACSTAMKVLSGLDGASTLISVGSMCVGVATMLTPVGAPIVAASSIGCAISGLYTAGRCTQQLADRGTHRQSISVTDKQGRAAWIGVAGGVAGIVATGAKPLFERAVRTGVDIGSKVSAAYNTVTVGNLIINGIGIGNGVYDVYETYTKTGNFTYLEIAQLAAHLSFFCNAVLNLETAGKLIERTQGKFFQEYEASLRSGRHRRAFRRLTRKALQANDNPSSAFAEIIRKVRMINNRDDFFAVVGDNGEEFGEGLSSLTPGNTNENLFSSMPTRLYNEQLELTGQLVARLFGELAKEYLGNPHALGRVIIQMQNMGSREELLIMLIETAVRFCKRLKHSVSLGVYNILDFMWNFVVEKAGEYMAQFDLERRFSRASDQTFKRERGIGPTDNLFDHFVNLVMKRLHDSFNEWYEEMIDQLHIWVKEQRERIEAPRESEETQTSYLVCKICSGRYVKKT